MFPHYLSGRLRCRKSKRRDNFFSNELIIFATLSISDYSIKIFHSEIIFYLRVLHLVIIYPKLYLNPNLWQHAITLMSFKISFGKLGIFAA